MPVRHVDPHKKRSRVYNAIVKLGSSRAGRVWGRHIGPRIDPPLYRLSRGRYPFVGMLTAPLVTTGAKSGLPREVPLTYFHDGRDVILVASNFGGSQHPAWYYNLVAHPECKFGDGEFLAEQVTDADEHARLYALAENVFPGYAGYRAKAEPVGRTIPVFRLTPQ
jgi:deazaflavin-dependent oxidoreductase (nitroreductase family)